VWPCRPIKGRDRLNLQQPNTGDPDAQEKRTQPTVMYNQSHHHWVPPLLLLAVCSRCVWGGGGEGAIPRA
jgi:hypothetical protein